ncbi:Hypothetical protein PHPALM_10058 [Phytophthora palmivora]|uniref:CMP/dCMP-type deaminase domain-containing protein n=1 Tax=Phytophthora palmivora TaxID=4796 RepID=A0A2P4Y5Q2_9STRA|nr:Hypothetical protein PHPALM_10058 [Phytophthora palmivora]
MQQAQQQAQMQRQNSLQQQQFQQNQALQRQNSMRQMQQQQQMQQQMQQRQNPNYMQQQQQQAQAQAQARAQAQAQAQRNGAPNGGANQPRMSGDMSLMDPEVDEQVATSEVSGELQTKYKFETLYHPVMVAVDGVAERDRRREVEVDETARKKQKCVKGDESRPALKEEKSNGELLQSESYLCTGYDVYLDREPCAMCAMALVHSRARRVVFDRANPDDGVLMSSFKLHTIKSLNHHYRVFQLSLTSEEKTALNVAVRENE